LHSIAPAPISMDVRNSVAAIFGLGISTSIICRQVEPATCSPVRRTFPEGRTVGIGDSDRVVVHDQLWLGAAARVSGCSGLWHDRSPCSRQLTVDKENSDRHAAGDGAEIVFGDLQSRAGCAREMRKTVTTAQVVTRDPPNSKAPEDVFPFEKLKHIPNIQYTGPIWWPRDRRVHRRRRTCRPLRRGRDRS
jgi:hypothetical protein